MEKNFIFVPSLTDVVSD